MNREELHIIRNFPKTESEVWDMLKTVNDPEIPVLSVTDLGVVREIKLHEDAIEVIITPTYSGCPAMDMIGSNIRNALKQNGFEHIKISHRLSPAWTTDWMSDSGKEKLRSYGIAPPHSSLHFQKHSGNITVECPHCHTTDTVLVSEFGSTACKALYKCNTCGEPFDYFKCH